MESKPKNSLVRIACYEGNLSVDHSGKATGNLLTGVNTCSFAMAKGKVKLMILAEDISENSRKKIMKEIRKYGVNHIEYGNSEELSHAVGASGRNVFAICDKGFAEAITKEIERELE